MAYDEVLADRVREALATEDGLTERKMFGGLGFMLDGHLAVAAGSGGSLMVRIDPADGESLVDGVTVAPMEMGGRTLRGWLLVEPAGLVDDDALREWVGRGSAYARTLPPKR